jgi:hypothetical protein
MVKPSLPHHGPSIAGTKVPFVPPSQSMVLDVSTKGGQQLEPTCSGDADFSIFPDETRELLSGRVQQVRHARREVVRAIAVSAGLSHKLERLELGSQPKDLRGRGSH